MKNIKSLPKTINITVNKTDIEKSYGYGSQRDCYLATALKRLKYPMPYVGAYDVQFSTKTIRKLYKMSIKDSDALAEISKYNPKKVKVTLKRKTILYWDRNL